MPEEKFDTIIVGGGISGLISAYLLASEGLEVLLVEKGNFCGAKNMTGGRLYAHSIEEIFPSFADTAPVEREVCHERLTLLSQNDSVSLDFTCNKKEIAKERSYTVLRAKFDLWLSEMAENAGANIITGVRVDDVIREDGKIVGIIAGDEQMKANVVILADGANSTLTQKLGLVQKPEAKNYAVGVKEIISLDEEIINDRFQCDSHQGTSWLFAGDITDGLIGGGFLYTNKDSISLGVVFGLHNISKTNISVPQMLENFKNHPTIKPLIKNGKSLEYSAHIVPEGGFNTLPTLCDDGVILVGDCAGLCLNIGYTVRGMDLAVESGKLAANAIIKACEKKDFSKNTLSFYEEELKKSFVLKDLELYKNTPLLLDNERIFKDYPLMATNIMNELFTVNGASKPILKKILPHVKKVGFLNILKDAYKGVRSL